MGLQKIEITGFRSLENVIWEPGSLNVLIGLNGSGKSNLLRALTMLKHSAEGKLSESIRAAGGMLPLLWDGETNTIGFHLYFESPNLLYELVIERLGQSGDFRIAREFLAHDKFENGEVLSFHKYLERTNTRADIFTHEQVGLEIKPEEINEDETLLAQFLAPAPGGIGTHFIGLVRRRLADYRIYHDVRVDSNAEMRRAAVSRRDLRVEPDGNNLISVLHTLYSTDRAFRDELNTAMKAAFGNEFEELTFPPAEDGRIQLRLRWRSLKREQSASDLSDGTLRFLFLLAVLGNTDPPPLIAIDEPETGLHPSMLPLIAEYASDAARRTQIILTTHSPEFLNAFQNRADIVTIVESREGKTQLRRLSESDLTQWLEHYQLGDLWLSGELEKTL